MAEPSAQERPLPPVDIGVEADPGDGIEKSNWNHVHALGTNPGFEVWLDATQDLTDGSTTTILFDTEIIDTASGYDLTTGIYTVQATHAGWWSFTAGLEWPADADGARQLLMTLNGTATQIASTRKMAVSAVALADNIGRIIRLAVGDTVRVRGLHSAGGTLAVGGNRPSHFAGVRLSA